ncbi:MAG: methylated-DNA--[protein]-cysteine S-methyltransferase [Clostridiaceae bacterium]
MSNIFFYDTTIGRMTIEESDNCITYVHFGEVRRSDSKIVETDLLKKAGQQLKEYFEGTRLSFDLPLKMEGTDFQIKVWNALLQIPFGETRSYKEIAEAVGNPLGSRAIGNANNKNKISIIVPCHRVIGANGKLVGYEGGLDVKEKLLNFEKEVKSNLYDTEKLG